MGLLHAERRCQSVAWTRTYQVRPLPSAGAGGGDTDRVASVIVAPSSPRAMAPAL